MPLEMLSATELQNLNRKGLIRPRLSDHDLNELVAEEVKLEKALSRNEQQKELKRLDKMSVSDAC